MHLNTEITQRLGSPIPKEEPIVTQDQQPLLGRDFRLGEAHDLPVLVEGFGSGDTHICPDRGVGSSLDQRQRSPHAGRGIVQQFHGGGRGLWLWPWQLGSAIRDPARYAPQQDNRLHLLSGLDLPGR